MFTGHNVNKCNEDGLCYTSSMDTYSFVQKPHKGFPLIHVPSSPPVLGGFVILCSGLLLIASFAILYLLSVSILAQLVRLLSVWKPNSPTVVLLCLFAHHLHPSGSTPGYRQLVHALGHLRHTVCTCSFRTQRIPLTTGAWLWWKKLHYFSFTLWHHLAWKLRTCVIVS